MFKNRAVQVKLVKSERGAREETQEDFARDNDRLMTAHLLIKEQVEHTAKVVGITAASLIAVKTLSRLILQAAK